MPDHIKNMQNGRQLHELIESDISVFRGRISNLPIYTIRASALISSGIAGTLANVISSIKSHSDQDWKLGNRRSDHEDRLGNLPNDPGNGIVYREYHVPGNGAPASGYWRLVADIKNRRLYISPTHYEVWFRNQSSANSFDPQQEVPATHEGAQNPFFLLAGAAAWNSVFI